MTNQTTIQTIQTNLDKIKNDAAILCPHFGSIISASYLCRQLDHFVARRSDLSESIYLHTSIYFDILSDIDEPELSFAFSAISAHCEMAVH